MKRKSLPVIAPHVGVESHQSLHHFLTQSPWLVSGLQAHRLQRTLEWLAISHNTIPDYSCALYRVDPSRG
ncbi:hypothetical protein JX360_11055 [Synechococcus bigranulatus str. 'Rupite']|uniref:Uncharacterized protein n=2 Tax=Thermostichus vulcanus TaxID=32053 RepID=A0ABT0CCF3_THEVL|nr:hypothetical protein [Thermostichus vulcanus str. 'Rupite']